MNGEQQFRALLHRVGTRDWNDSASHCDAILAEVRDLIEHGEMGVALENLCQYLYEYDVALRLEDLEVIRAITDAMKMPRSTWEVLEGAASGGEEA